MRALVTGAAGFVGRHLVEHLLSEGDEVLGLVHPSDHARGTLRAGVEERVVDILDDAALERVLFDFSPEVVFHLAAFSNPEGSWREARLTLETNILGAHNVLAASASAATGKAPRVLLVGSAQQYGHVPEDEQPIREDRELGPLTPYAVSKASQELLGQRAYRSEGLPVVLTRSFNHTGPGQADGYVCSSFARQVAEIEKGIREPVIRVGNLAARRDFADVRDVASAYRLLVERGRPGRAYNVCSGEAVSIQEVLDRLVGLSRVEVRVVIDPDRYHALDAPLIVGDPARLREETGFSPRFKLRDTLRDLLEDWRAKL
jgi:GDP-4-dehydro-6-deoxy-D-mannose reductase